MNAQKLIYDRFIAPLKKPRASYIGIEIEMPVVNLSGEKTDKFVSIAANNIAAQDKAYSITAFVADFLFANSFIFFIPYFFKSCF